MTAEQLPPQPLLSTLLNNLPGMAYHCRFDGRRSMLFVSSGCRDLTGYAAAELLREKGTAFDELIQPEDRTAVIQEIEAAIVEQRPYVFTYRLNTAEGREQWVHDKGEAILNPDGTVRSLEGFIADYNERMKWIELLEQRVADRTRRLSALYDILEAASDPSDLQATITRSLRRVLRAVSGSVGTIQLLDKSGETLNLVAQKELPEEVGARFSQIKVMESALSGWVVRHNEPLLIPDMRADERTSGLAQSTGLGVYIAVPIVANDQVRGVLTVMSDDLTRYTAKEENELLSSVGEQLGVVVENARLRAQAEQLVVLEERNRLARELHDSVTQSLYSVTLFAEAGLNLSRDGRYERVGSLFADVLETGQQALKEMRLLVHKLRPSILEKEGLARALQHRLSAVEGRAGIKNELICPGELAIDPEVEEELFYVAQEALNNSLKHARASEVSVRIAQSKRGALLLTVKDNGQGFDPAAAAEGSGLGLVSMRERVEALGGTIAYKSTPGEGAAIRVRLSGESGWRLT